MRRQVERIEAWDLVRDDAHHDRVRSPLLEDVDAEAAASGQAVTQVGGTVPGELGGRFGIIAEDRHRDHLRLESREFSHAQRRGGIQAATDLHLRLLPAGEVQVADIL